MKKEEQIPADNERIYRNFFGSFYTILIMILILAFLGSTVYISFDIILSR